MAHVWPCNVSRVKGIRVGAGVVDGLGFNVGVKVGMSDEKDPFPVGENVGNCVGAGVRGTACSHSDSIVEPDYVRGYCCI